jgi:hypothetical protein
MPSVAYGLGGVRDEQQTEGDRTNARMAQMMFEREMRARAEQIAQRNAELGANLTREGWDRQDIRDTKQLGSAADIAKTQAAAQMYGTDKTVEGNKYNTDAVIGGQRYTTDANMKMSDADRALKVQQMTADNAAKLAEQARLGKLDEWRYSPDAIAKMRDAEMRSELAKVIAAKKLSEGGDFTGFDPNTNLPTFTASKGADFRKSAAATQEFGPQILSKYSGSIEEARNTGDAQRYTDLINEMRNELLKVGADPDAVIRPLVQKHKTGLVGTFLSPLSNPLNPMAASKINNAIYGMGE